MKILGFLLLDIGGIDVIFLLGLKIWMFLYVWINNWLLLVGIMCLIIVFFFMLFFLVIRYDCILLWLKL